MQPTLGVTRQQLLVYSDEQSSAPKQDDTSKKVEEAHKRVQEERVDAVKSSGSKKAKVSEETVSFQNKKVSCTMTVSSQDDVHVLGYGTISYKTSVLKENSYEGSIKVVKATSQILRDGEGKMTIGQICTYKALFKDNDEVKRL